MALHRLLKWRLKKYDPVINLGGYIYIFMRGLQEVKRTSEREIILPSTGVFIGDAPIKRINYLDKLFSDE